MSPYLTAFEKYHIDGPPAYSWREVMEFHLQFGAVIATPGAFIMARRVWAGSPPEVQLSLSPLQSLEEGDCWHVWAAAGSLEALAMIADHHRVPFVSFLRRADLRLRILPLARLLRHEFQSPEAAARSAARHRHRGGEIRCGSGGAPPPGEAL